MSSIIAVCWFSRALFWPSSAFIVSRCCFALRLSLGAQRRHGFLVLRHVLPVLGVALLRGLAHDVESNPDEAALRSPDGGGDPYGGLLSREGGLLQGEACGFVFCHSAISDPPRVAASSPSFARSGG